MHAWATTRLLLLVVAGGISLSSCAKLASHESVAVTAINYTDQELNSYLFRSVDEPTKVAGGPPVGPFEGAGTMCCFSLPARWRPGIKVQLTYDWWNGSAANRQHITKELEVPQYPDGQVGTLWALFYADGSVEVVSSDFAPGHAKWPGREKGWPKPSLAYKRKVWQEEYDQEKGQVEDFEQMATSPAVKDIEESWAHYKERDPGAIEGMSGPMDPRFVHELKARFAKAAMSAKERMKQLEEARP